MHYQSSRVILEKDMMSSFFRKRARTSHGDSIYNIFARAVGNKGLNLEERFSSCVVCFHFTDNETMCGEIKKYFEYGPGRSIISYMKTMIDYLVNKREMTDGGHFCIVVDKK